jgi:hypothetical protein
MTTDARTRRDEREMQDQRFPTVAELRAMSDEELVRRHDAAAARSSGAGGTATGLTLYIDELRARTVERQALAMARVAWAAFVISATALVIVIAVLVIAA